MTTSEHAKPLSPGEIRMARVGRVIFKVMHIAGGSFTQAIALRPDAPTEVIATEMFEQDAVRAYAEAIEQAEADHADADREDDAPEPLTAEDEEAPRVRSGFTPTLPTVPQDRSADGVPEVEQASAPAPARADDVAALRSDLNTGMGRIRSIGRWSGSAHEALEYLGRAAETLDRIAGAVPQRATDADELSKGDPLWLHGCGGVMPGEGDREPDECPRHWCIGGPWRPLYVMPGDGA